jgi:CBS domain-containing protein
MNVGDVCIRKVAIVEKNETIVAAAQVMRELGTGDVVVVERENGGNDPIGVLTDRDVVLRGVSERRDLASTTVFELMTLAPVVAEESEDIFRLIDRMRGHGVRRVPVVSADGLLVGIVAYDDLVELLASTLAKLTVVVDRASDREANASSWLHTCNDATG